MSQPNQHLHIGAIVFPDLDQSDLTGPFTVLSRIPHSTFHMLWKRKTPVRDLGGLIMTPDAAFDDAPPLDVLVVPGGFGQEALMDDEVVLGFIRTQAERGAYIFSVCTGALLCGAAGLLRGVRTTTHWAAHHLLVHFGAIPVHERVVVEGKHISASGITAGLDGALCLAALLRDEHVAQGIQLTIEYAPKPQFQSGTPETAPPDVLEAVRASYRQVTEARLATARRIAVRLGISTD